MNSGIYTVGHSSWPLTEFLAPCEAHGMEVLADVRSIPRWGRLPRFRRRELAAALAGRGVRYLEMGTLLMAVKVVMILGGLRRRARAGGRG